ncbi:alkaline phosphatase family protein [Solicola gregarius]|uniref:Sulfatase-like hydrolase/transferase n=1 Tax=Solicola gregarius TaxID=2908642 RepID=A0AA46TL35_9ACTN|nr:sulfatase-like hydrolase/transferase [Solicola gregarius]UYM07113.1 sulfatase-like hydrolase/transferase [Solicola gregarius]
MSHVLTTAPDALVPFGTNASIEQPFGAVADPHRPTSPNILVIKTDLDASRIGAYAGDGAATANLDRLSKSGTRFTAVAGTPGPPALHLVLDLLADRGYDAAGYDYVDPAIAFLGLRRDAPWAVYLSLPGADADDGVGALDAALRRSEQYRSTLVLLVGSHGARTPTLLAWPGQIAPRQRHDAPITCSDWVPTLLEAADPGATYGLGLDGVDLGVHLFDGGSIPQRPAIRRPRAA